MKTRLPLALAGVCLIAAVLPAASPRVTIPYERIICVVPYVGAGTLADPKRPMFAPVAGASLPPTKPTKGFVDPPQIVSYTSEPTDDGTLAIVEFVARDRAAFQPILKNTLGLTVLDPKSLTASQIVQRLKLLKQNFDLNIFLAGVL